ncbi:MAG: ribonuclease III [Rhodospirillaceae bacterium]
MTPRRHPLEQVLGHRFEEPNLLSLALTHRGSLGSGKSKSNVVGNETLEFLGDRVLGLVIAEALLRRFPEDHEGALAARLAALVSAAELSRVAQDMGLVNHLKIARAQKLDPAATAVLADACEAVIGALYLDGGLEKAADFIHRHWASAMEACAAPPKDPKMALQEWAQGRGLPLPAYREIEAAGPAHAPSFTMGVTVKGHAEVLGKGRTKRLATQAAATALLAELSEKKK